MDFRFYVSGMRCVACSRSVEKAARMVNGVIKARVNFIAGTLCVEVSEGFSKQALFEAVNLAGYAISEEAPVLYTDAVRLILTAALSLLTLSCPMFSNQHWVPIAFVQALLALSVLLVNAVYWMRGFKTLLAASPTMDSLVAIGSLTSFAYSAYLLLVQHEMRPEVLYFDSAVMIYAFVDFGKWIESRAKVKSTDALSAFAQSIPQQATRRVGNRDERVAIGSIAVGDTLVVRAGEAIACDGRLVSGACEVDESGFTGESLPKTKRTGDCVLSGTLLVSGFALIEVESVGEATTYGQILSDLRRIVETKAPIERMADRVSAVFVPIVIAVAMLTFFLWEASTHDLAQAVSHAIGVLVVSCPCALGLATPLAVTITSGIAARHGLFFKSAAAIEELSRVNSVVFDKTGTLTLGQFALTRVVTRSGLSETTVLRLAASVERFSSHPLARALVAASNETPLQTTAYQEHQGFVTALVEGETVDIGNADALGLKTPLGFFAQGQVGQTVLYMRRSQECVAAFYFSDILREGVPALLSALKRRGLKVSVASGDEPHLLANFGRTLGVSSSLGGLSPVDKAAYVHSEKARHRVLFVGDGVNDAMSLATAHVGATLTGATDVAKSSADLVILSGAFGSLALGIDLARRATANIRGNLFWAFFYNTLAIPVASGLVPGVTATPMLCALAMSLSSLFVVGNAMRLFSEEKSRQGNQASDRHQKKERNMKTEVRIEGMMCEHCVVSVKKALATLPGVTEVEVDLKGARALLVSEMSLSEDLLRQALEAKDFTFVSKREL